MITTAKPQRTPAEMNKRLGEIGLELAAKGRITPAANAKELEAEESALKIEYAAALQRESEEARDAVEINRRVELARQQKLADEREARIKKAAAEAAP